MVIQTWRTIRNSKWSRDGFGVTELIVSMILLGAIVSTMIPLIVQLPELNQTSRRRFRAEQMARNLVEVVSGFESSQLESENLDEDVWTEAAKEIVGESEFEYSVAPREIEGEDRIAVEIVVRYGSESASRPVRLTTWRRRAGGTDE